MIYQLSNFYKHSLPVAMATTIFQNFFHKHILLHILYKSCKFHAINTFPYNGVTRFHQNSIAHRKPSRQNFSGVTNISMLVISKSQSATEKRFIHKLLFFVRQTYPQVWAISSYYLPILIYQLSNFYKHSLPVARAVVGHPLVSKRKGGGLPWQTLLA